MHPNPDAGPITDLSCSNDGKLLMGSQKSTNPGESGWHIKLWDLIDWKQVDGTVSAKSNTCPMPPTTMNAWNLFKVYYTDVQAAIDANSTMVRFSDQQMIDDDTKLEKISTIVSGDATGNTVVVHGFEGGKFTEQQKMDASQMSNIDNLKVSSNGNVIAISGRTSEDLLAFQF